MPRPCGQEREKMQKMLIQTPWLCDFEVNKKKKTILHGCVAVTDYH